MGAGGVAVGSGCGVCAGAVGEGGGVSAIMDACVWVGGAMAKVGGMVGWCDVWRVVGVTSRSSSSSVTVEE